MDWPHEKYQIISRYCRDFKNGVRGLITWARFAWRFRPWDYQYAYEAYFIALSEIRRHILEHRHHVDWAQDASQIYAGLLTWDSYLNNYGTDQEDHAWNALHEHIKNHARGWRC